MNTINLVTNQGLDSKSINLGFGLRYSGVQTLRYSGVQTPGLRLAIITEAKSWLRTPWHHAAAVKHAGVDCGRYLIEVYAACGLIERFVPDPYPQDFALHSKDELFLQAIERYAVKIDTPQAGDIAVFKYGRCYSHAAIVIDYPHIIHAKINEGVILDLADQGDLLNREVRFYTVINDCQSLKDWQSSKLGK